MGRANQDSVRAKPAIFDNRNRQRDCLLGLAKTFLYRLISVLCFVQILIGAGFLIFILLFALTWHLKMAALAASVFRESHPVSAQKELPRVDLERVQGY